MKKILFMIVTILISSIMLFAQPIQYLHDSIIEKNDNYVRLLGGSQWQLVYPALALVADDVLIVFHSVKNKQNKSVIVPVFYIEGQEVPAQYLGGNIQGTKSGYLTTIIASNSSGSRLQTIEGYIVHVPEYDQYDTGWWLPPYEVIISNDQMYMYNLKEGKQVWIDGVTN